MAKIDNTLSRRAALVGASALAGSVVNLSAIVASRSAEPDQYARLSERWRAMCATWAERERRYRQIADEVDRACPPPEVLRALPSDKDFGFEDALPVGSEHYTLPHQFTGDMGHPLHVENRNGELRVSPGRPWPEKQARATEILECITEWRAKCDALFAKLGYDPEVDQEETDALSDEQNEIEDAIAAVPVTTAAEAIAKAKLVAEVLRYYDDLEDRDYDTPIEKMTRELIHSFAGLSGPVQA